MDRLNTKRKNPMERRRDSSEIMKDCAAESCPVSIVNHNRLEAAFNRLDEERRISNNRHDAVSAEVKKLSNSIGDRVRLPIFTWVIGILIVIFSTLLGVVWSHQGDTERLAKKTTEKIETIAVENAQKIGVTTTRIDDFLRANEVFQKRNTADIDRVFDKLDEIDKSLKKLEVDLVRQERDCEK